MPVPPQNIAEYLSVSYVSSVVAKAGFILDIPTRDFGVDVSVRRVGKYRGKLSDMGVMFDCQLKASINWREEKCFIVYDLEADAYNKMVLRNQEPVIPILLVLLCLPVDESEWVNISEYELKLRKCCYYIALTGQPTDNARSIRIRIPRTNIFSPDAVRELVEIVRHRGEIA